MDEKRERFRKTRRRQRIKEMEEDIERYRKEENPWPYLAAVRAGNVLNFDTISVNDEVGQGNENENVSRPFLKSTASDPESEIAIKKLLELLSPEAKLVAETILQLSDDEIYKISNHFPKFVRDITGKGPKKIIVELRTICLFL